MQHILVLFFIHFSGKDCVHKLDYNSLESSLAFVSILQGRYLFIGISYQQVNVTEKQKCQNILTY